ncbi:MAG: NADH-quinone oxidoreductase subunit NuoE [Chloroflexota bacterium]
MLTSEEQRAIEAELGHYEQAQAAAIEALKIVQEHRGWVSDEALGDLAPLLGMSVAELDGVATFYNIILRRPVGRHVIRICNSISCWVMGYENLHDYLLSRLNLRQLGETTADGRFTLLPNVCLGCCDIAPAMMVDDDLYGELTPDKIDQALLRYE